MAVQTYSVTTAAVLTYLPITSVTATSRPLSESDITAFIEDAASQMSGVLENSGLDPTDLDDDTTAQVQEAVIKGAVYAAMQKVPGVSDQRLERARVDWESLRDRYTNRPKVFTKRRTRALSNVSTAADKTASEFEGIKYEF
jgi:hypothetical protein